LSYLVNSHFEVFSDIINLIEMKNNRFGGAIWTDHALERMKERGIPKEYAIDSFKSPDFSEVNRNGLKLTKKIEDKTITMVSTRNERGESVIVSIWMDPPMVGTKDYKNKQRYNEYRKAGIGKKIWMTILRQIGL